MRRAVASALAAIALAGCATLQAKRTAEVVDTEAADAYVAIAQTVNAYEAIQGATPAAEAFKLKAWTLYSQEHKAFATGAVADITSLLQMAADAPKLFGAK